ncbi:MAG: DEAD/DEAH box helicase, partial [Chitinophagaceae bacterium]|nr:DEAD/DEAH box helicase [Chitinophagaceae bacterium]
MNQSTSILQEYWGYSTFRPGQQAVIDAVLAGKDALAIMPTGGGKSICYQVPALQLP